MSIVKPNIAHQLKNRSFVALNRFADFSCSADLHTWKNIYGERLGLHFWNKFTRYNRDLTRLYLLMDNDNRKKLVDYIGSQ